ncbi:MAG: ferrous iron transport protein A [Clostridiales bacterium]|nr:ferrous iron transport protein A [Clostridiales bacterium]
MNNRHTSKNTEKSIYYAKDGCEYIVTSAPDLGILKSLGIVKDTSIHKRMTHKLGGPVLLMVQSSSIAIGKDIAEQILVRG